MSEDTFLAQCGWSDALKKPLAGDASSRRYTRLTKPSGTAILMDEGAGSAAQLDRFAFLSRHLRSLGLSAPEILADGSDRFLLIEDLGDNVFARVIKTQPALEPILYEAAIDALIVSQNGPIPQSVTPYGPKEMTDAIKLAFEWYPTPETQYSADVVDHIYKLFQTLLTQHLTGPNVLIQRDFHAENLIWLPDRDGHARAGLLDFQDAVSGHPSYDLASLLVDARRDVLPSFRHEMIDLYILKTGCEPLAFKTAFALCSAQRNLRILGIFSALSIRDGKPSYVDLIPRAWTNLMADLEHPALAELKQALTILPTPSDDMLIKIRAAHV